MSYNRLAANNCMRRLMLLAYPCGTGASPRAYDAPHAGADAARDGACRGHRTRDERRARREHAAPMSDDLLERAARVDGVLADARRAWLMWDARRRQGFATTDTPPPQAQLDPAVVEEARS